MSSIKVIFTDTIKAPKSSDQNIDLTPWDLQHLPGTPTKNGLLYHHALVANQIQHLRHSLSSSLTFFPPLAGRLKITEHKDNTMSCSVICNNDGVLFIHAEAEDTYVADILEPTYVPSVIESFFAFNGVRNYEGTSQPLLAVQVTELVDGIFIGCTFNHVVVDGSSMWHFFNSWAEISRTSCHQQISKLPTLEHWFPDGIQRPILFPFTIEPQKNLFNGLSFSSFVDEKLYISERIFHFTKEKIEQLKSKVNAKIDGAIKISSLQALLSHVWCSFIRSKQIDPQEHVHNIYPIGVRQRFVPQLPEHYFGNTIIGDRVTIKAGDLLEEGGLFKAAREMNKVIASHSDENLKNQYESWLRNPILKSLDSVTNNNLLIMSNSPRFDVYGNDFGWGKPITVRSANNNIGTVNMFGGIEEGSIDLHVRLPYNILETMGNDLEAMDVVSN